MPGHRSRRSLDPERRTHALLELEARFRIQNVQPKKHLLYDNSNPFIKTIPTDVKPDVCVTNLQNSLAPPTACNLQAAGRKRDGSFVYHSLIFNPGPNQDIPGNFSYSTFPSTFTDLVEMNMAIVYSDQPSIVVAMIYDNNQYEACR